MDSLTLLSDARRPTGAYALGPEAGEWLQQATLAIRARVPLDVLADTIRPFPSFSGIYNAALKALDMQIANMPAPARPMAAQAAILSGWAAIGSPIIAPLPAEQPVCNAC
jgi:hypothetical protein